MKVITLLIYLFIFIGCLTEDSRKINVNTVESIDLSMRFPSIGMSINNNKTINDSITINKIIYYFNECSISHNMSTAHSKGQSFDVNIYTNNGIKKYFRIGRTEYNHFEIDITGNFENTGIYSRYDNDSLGVYLSDLFSIDSLLKIHSIGSGLPCNK